MTYSNNIDRNSKILFFSTRPLSMIRAYLWVQNDGFWVRVEEEDEKNWEWIWWLANRAKNKHEEKCGNNIPAFYVLVLQPSMKSPIPIIAMYWVVYAQYSYSLFVWNPRHLSLGALLLQIIHQDWFKWNEY